MSTYRSALALPGAAAFSAAGALARLPQAMLGLGSVLMLTGLGRSYGLAGVVAGAIALSQGVASPWLGRVIDRRGQARVLLPQLVLHAATVIALVIAAQRDAVGWVLVVVAALAGASMPQFGASARARWTALLGDRPPIDAALSFESLIDEAVFIVGPVLVSALATLIAPAAGVITAVVIVTVGGAMFISQRRTEPAPRPEVIEDVGAGAAIRSRGLQVLVGVFFWLGALFGLIEVGVVALARELGRPGATGLMLGLWATGSLICGAFYGGRRWRSGPARRFQLGAAAMAAGAVLVALAAHSVVLETIALVLAGLANAPTLITGNTLVPRVVAAHTVTEAYTWLGVTVFAGVALGAPVGGALIDHAGAAAALWAAVIAGAAATVMATAGRSQLTSA